ncbi:MAG TPA: hypothetical protein VKP58_00885 [Candidatus Acidoferrum sp.]|jgi:hypothetical protein|nr:hypothetical protein [Candidatus Acidoferrum sp.]
MDSRHRCEREFVHTFMAHLAIQEKLDGKVVDWTQHVSDAQYRR